MTGVVVADEADDTLEADAFDGTNKFQMNHNPHHSLMMMANQNLELEWMESFKVVPSEEMAVMVPPDAFYGTNKFQTNHSPHHSLMMMANQNLELEWLENLNALPSEGFPLVEMTVVVLPDAFDGTNKFQGHLRSQGREQLTRSYPSLLGAVGMSKVLMTHLRMLHFCVLKAKTTQLVFRLKDCWIGPKGRA
ncbi:hypothetical protein LguiB_009468 [Lonicera macranthoides]